MKNQNVDIYKLAGSFIASVYAFVYVQSYTSWHFIDAANLIFHEAGHTLAIIFPQIIYIAAGSAFQILLPLCFSLYFFKDRQFFSGAILLFWVGINIINVSYYASDSIVMQLPLLGGDSSIHDWNFMLTYFNVLQYTPIIAKSIYTAGVLVLILAGILSFLYSRKVEEFHVRDF